MTTPWKVTNRNTKKYSLKTLDGPNVTAHGFVTHSESFGDLVHSTMCVHKVTDISLSASDENTITLWANGATSTYVMLFGVGLDDLQAAIDKVRAEQAEDKEVTA